MYNSKYLKVDNPSKKNLKNPSPQVSVPFESQEGFMNGLPPEGHHYRILGDTLFNPTPFPITAVANTGQVKKLARFDTTPINFDGADYVDEYLDDDQIAELKKGGYIIEEYDTEGDLPKAQDAGVVPWESSEYFGGPSTITSEGEKIDLIYDGSDKDYIGYEDSVGDYYRITKEHPQYREYKKLIRPLYRDKKFTQRMKDKYWDKVHTGKKEYTPSQEFTDRLNYQIANKGQVKGMGDTDILEDIAAKDLGLLQGKATYSPSDSYSKKDIRRDLKKRSRLEHGPQWYAANALDQAGILSVQYRDRKEGGQLPKAQKGKSLKEIALEKAAETQARIANDVDVSESTKPAYSTVNKDIKSIKDIPATNALGRKPVKGYEKELENLGKLDSSKGYDLPASQILNTIIGEEGIDFREEGFSPIAYEQDLLNMYLGNPTYFLEATGNPNEVRTKNWSSVLGDTLPTKEMYDIIAPPRKITKIDSTLALGPLLKMYPDLSDKERLKIAEKYRRDQKGSIDDFGKGRYPTYFDTIYNEAGDVTGGVQYAPDFIDYGGSFLGKIADASFKVKGLGSFNIADESYYNFDPISKRMILDRTKQEGGYVDMDLEEDDINFLNFIGVRTEDI